jgi:metallo-beta-lactamase family protein
MTLETQESKDIYKSPNPKIVMAGSGMSNGGRIIHHEQNYLPDAKNTLLLIGYQSMGTLGRKIEDGQKKVRIFGDDVDVKAGVAKISGYSGHKDSDHLIDFVQGSAETLEKVFVVMGEPKSSMFLAQRLRDGLAVNASAPQAGESVLLEWN